MSGTRASTEQEVAEVKQMLLRQLRAVAMKEQRRDRDVRNGVNLQIATELFQDTIVTRQPILCTAFVSDKLYLVEY